MNRKTEINKKEKITYEELIDQLKKYPPAPEHPEELTASILAGIRNLPEKKPKNKIVLFTAWICGTAAIFLTSLLCLELLVTPDEQPIQKSADLPIWYSTVCREEGNNRKMLECFLKERENRKLQKEFLFRNFKN